MTDRRMYLRMVLVAVMLVAAWSGLGYRLGTLHLGPNEELRENVRKMRKVEKKIHVARGRILDVKGRHLAVDLAVNDVCVDPSKILAEGNMQAVGTCLARVLDLDPSAVFFRINRPGDPFERVKRFVPFDVADRIQRMQLPGVWFPETTTRYYPHGSMFCHVVGFSNLEGVGSAGVELGMDRYLTGRPGLLVSEKDGNRQEIYTRRSLEIDPEQGCDVYLTIDANVQYMVEKALDMAVCEHQAKGAWAVVQEVRTGRVLAMACRPEYDLNLFRCTPADAMLNRVIGFTYEPGSTMKGLAFSAAFNEGLVNEHVLMDCENGTWFYRGRPLRDFHPYGILTVADVLKKSSNIGTAKITLMLGEARLEKYLRAFGIGRATGIDLPGEESGILWGRDRWSSLSITRIPMGHGELSVTALQMAAAYSAIANNGFLLRPLIVDRVVDSRGGTVFRAETEVVGRPIREDTSRLMRRLLNRVTQDGGTARRARVDGYSVAGKTGTSEKVVNGVYCRDANVASFAGFIPAREPELTILVVVDEPQPYHTGGRVAGPVFQEIASQVVRYLDIPPDEMQPQLGGTAGAAVQPGSLASAAMGQGRSLVP